MLVRAEPVLLPDTSRVVARPFVPGGMNFGGGLERLGRIAERVAQLTPSQVTDALAGTTKLFADRHRDLEGLWVENFESAAAHSPELRRVEGESRLLLGAYLTMEYAFEGAALTNPSIVPHPEEPARAGRVRFVMSLRAIGEGHISSIEFRTGTVGEDGDVAFDPVGRTASVGQRRPTVYRKDAFHAKLRELLADNDVAHRVLDPLPERFEVGQLEEALAELDRSEIPKTVAFETTRLIHWLSTSNYEVWFGEEPLSQRLLMPRGPADSRGMEDARFVRFTDEDGSVTYFATYTAFDGYQILPQLIATRDFGSFRIATLSGACAQNKGMALFPRRVDGHFVALGRHDQESIFVMRSDDIRSWNNAELVYPPTFGWEAVQVGNCGSPIETEAGWLVVTHGVGPMRRYVLGAILLDLDDPGKVVARLPEPLLEPEPDERDGYVPNVVYSCGGMLHGDRLILPYGFSDRGTGVATVSVPDLIDEMI